MSPRFSIRLLAGQTDERLLALARSGHERAFEALVQRYRRPLIRYCRRTMRLADARAEDVVQQSLLKAWIALTAGTEVRDFKPWLYSIVRNTALNAIRGPAEGNVALSDAIRTDASVESEFERRIQLHDTLTHVAALPRAQRDVIFLTAIDGQSQKEVASALGITNGAVRGLLYRARMTLRKAAAAITPQPLIAWAAGAAGNAGSSAGRVADVSSGAGALGAGGLLAKGAVLAVTAGALATGAVVQLEHSSPRHSSAKTASAPLRRAAEGGPAIVVASRAAGAIKQTRAAAHGGWQHSSAAGSGRGPTAGAAPRHRSGSPIRWHEVASEPGSSGEVSASGTSAASATVATTAAAPTPAPEPTQTQPAPPPTEQPKVVEPEGGTGSCKGTEPATETKTCPDE
jgi:RNA polymerase sigma factor (sigma-70 family)